MRTAVPRTAYRIPPDDWTAVRSEPESLAHGIIDYGDYSDEVRVGEAAARIHAFFIATASTSPPIDMGAYLTIWPRVMHIFSRGMPPATTPDTTTAEDASSGVEQEIELSEQELLLQQLEEIELPNELEQWFRAFVGQLRLPRPVDLGHVYREMESFYGSRDRSGH